MGLNLLSFFRRCLDSLCQAAKRRLRRWTKPDNQSLTPPKKVPATPMVGRE